MKPKNNAILTEQQVREIRQLYKDGASIARLADKYPVKKRAIYKVVHNISWRWVK